MKPAALIAGCVCTLALALSASAQVLMLDFGPTVAAGASLTSSPYHSANGSFSGSTWNTIGTADVTSGLLWSDGTGAAGVTLNLGATTTDASRTIGLGNTPGNGTGLTGTTMNYGIYANSAPARDGIFTGANSGNVRAVGVQIGGLAAGTYDIYITGRNTNTGAGHTQNFYAGKSSAAVDFDFTDTGVFAHKSLTYFASPTAQNDAWSGTALANYARFTVTLGSGDFLNLAAFGGAGDSRGFLNSIQIVAIPEPAVAPFLAGLTGFLVILSLKRRR